jgi:hypothetical protein
MIVVLFRAFPLVSLQLLKAARAAPPRLASPASQWRVAASSATATLGAHVAAQSDRFAGTPASVPKSM